MSDRVRGMGVADITRQSHPSPLSESDAPTNDIFADHAWYFRNALVCANYTDLTRGIHETTEFLEIFLRNLLLNESAEMQNRDMHISSRLRRMNENRNCTGSKE